MFHIALKRIHSLKNVISAKFPYWKLLPSGKPEPGPMGFLVGQDLVQPVPTFMDLPCRPLNSFEKMF